MKGTIQSANHRSSKSLNEPFSTRPRKKPLELITEFNNLNKSPREERTLPLGGGKRGVSSIMKKQLYILLIALSATLFGATQAKAQNAIFEKYSDMDDVEYICITKSMLNLMSSNKGVEINGVKISGITDALKVLLIINTDDDGVGRQMKSDFKTLKADKRYEMLMMVKDNFERVTTLYNSHDKDKELVMFIDESDSQTFIVLTGALSEEIINKILSK